MIINICGKEYETKCTAYTRFEYKQIFGTGIFQDLKKLNELNTRQEYIKEKLTKEGKSEQEINDAINVEMLDCADDFIDTIEKIAYIFIKDNAGVGSFKQWLESLDKIELSAEWIQGVTELAVSSFC